MARYWLCNRADAEAWGNQDRDLEHLQDHGEQALTDINLKVCCDDDHVTDFWCSVCWCP